ncbi:MAG: alpha/beta hydrolase [Myxococcales bacterium]|nr:alpha/beta hydrolase [Myxococcales bacterium]
MTIPNLEHKRVSSFDGTEIAYQVRGQGPAIVLANGLGGSVGVWRHQYAAFGERYRVICWDYRGLYGSKRPADLATLAIDQQTRDIEAVLAAEGVERALFIGWSMGVQVNFEYYRRRPEQFAGLVALNGTSGRPFATTVGGPMLERIMPLLMAVMGRGTSLIQAGGKAVTAWSGLVPMMKRLKLVGQTLDEAVFNDLASDFTNLDFEAYAETFRYLGEHDAADVLPRIRIPTLIVTGSGDIMTPLATAKAMARVIRDARLEIIEGGTHYTAVEYPAEVNKALLAFCEEIGW